ncbi:MAG: hypothetical protein MAG715_01355 [Methanonatronarchaeales archaeon]|nr:hypothetical protein [Methanonatronarchaeales archaeon]
MATSFFGAAHYVLVAYGVALSAVAIYNFWRAPPPAGHRPLLLVSLAVFGLGLVIDTGIEVGLSTQRFRPVAYLVMLSGLLPLLYLSLRIHLAMETPRWLR